MGDSISSSEKSRSADVSYLKNEGAFLRDRAIIVFPSGESAGSLDVADEQNALTDDTLHQPSGLKFQLSRFADNSGKVVSHDVPCLLFAIGAGDRIAGVAVPSLSMDLPSSQLITSSLPEFRAALTDAPPQVTQWSVWNEALSASHGHVTDEFAHIIGRRLAILKLSIKDKSYLTSRNITCPHQEATKPPACSLWQRFLSLDPIQTASIEANPCELTVWLSLDAVKPSHSIEMLWEAFKKAATVFESCGDPFRLCFVEKHSDRTSTPPVGMKTLDPETPWPSLLQDRPSEPLDVVEAVCRAFFAVLEVHRFEEKKVEALAALRPTIKLISFGDDEIYIGIMNIGSIPEGSAACRPKAGDSFGLQFTEHGALWPATVLPPSYALDDCVLLYVHRRIEVEETVDVATGATKKVEVLARHPDVKAFTIDMAETSIGSAEALWSILNTIDGHEITMISRLQTMTTETIVKGLQKLLHGADATRSTLRRHILLKDTRPVGRSKMWLGLEGLHLYKSVALGEQLDAGTLFYSVPVDEHGMSVGVIVGGPGTAKTTVVANAVASKILSRGVEQGEQLILSASSNHPCDVLVLRVMSALKDVADMGNIRLDHPEFPIRILRTHMEADEHRFLLAWLDKISKPLPDIANPVGDETGLRRAARHASGKLRLDSLALSTFDEVFASGLQEYLDAGERLTSNPRFHLFKHSAAWAALEWAGLVESSTSYPVLEIELDDEVVNIKELALECKINGDDASKKLLLRALKKVMAQVYALATVLVGTPVALGQHDVVRQAKPNTTLFLDEAGRATAAEFQSLLGHYAPSTVFLVGDPEQLQPVVNAGQAPSLYALGLSTSVLSLYADIRKWPTTRLLDQHRAFPGLMYLANHASLTKYGVRDSKCLDPSASRFSVVGVVKSAMRASGLFPHHAHERPIYVLQTIGSSTRRNATMSRTNDIHTAIAINLVEHLVSKGVNAAQITVITPYDFSKTTFRRWMVVASTGGQNGAGACGQKVSLLAVDVRTSDDIQGGENDIIVFVPTVVEEVGFVGEAYRLYVSLSRARCALLCVVESRNFSLSKKKGAQVFYTIFADASDSNLTGTISMDHPYCFHPSMNVPADEQRAVCRDIDLSPVTVGRDEQDGGQFEALMDAVGGTWGSMTDDLVSSGPATCAGVSGTLVDDEWGVVEPHSSFADPASAVDDWGDVPAHPATSVGDSWATNSSEIPLPPSDSSAL